MSNPYVEKFYLFFTAEQQEAFSHYSGDVIDKSLDTKLWKPSWKWMSTKVPVTVAPNVLNLAGLLCLIQAFYFCFMYMEVFPRTISMVAVVLVFLFHNLDSVSGIHARNIGNDSPLGELFQYACSNIGIVFTAIVICYVLDCHALPTLWYAVQIAQLICLREHIHHFKRGYVQISVLGGQGEVIWSFIGIVGLRIVFGLSPFNMLLDVIYQYVESPLSLLYYLLFVYSLIQCIFFLPYGSRNGVAFCLIYRAVPAVLIYYNLFSERTLLDIVCDGLFMSIITTDIIIAKMAKRDLHPWLVIMAMGSLLSNSVALFLVCFYYITIVSEVALFMNLPLFSVVRNVYVDGIYDMCHLGHKNAFKNAIKLGTRLLVGVICDEDASVYKRPPIMKTKERESAVAACKYVHKVISKAPCFGITKEFIKKHNIHVVALSEEYDNDEDNYYRVPREMGITGILPRTKGMSTSELIRRVVSYGEGLKSDKEAQEKEAKRIAKDKLLNSKK